MSVCVFTFASLYSPSWPLLHLISGEECFRLASHMDGRTQMCVCARSCVFNRFNCHKLQSPEYLFLSPMYTSMLHSLEMFTTLNVHICCHNSYPALIAHILLWFHYLHFTFFMHLADAFIQSDLQCIQAIHFYQFVCSLGIEPTTFALLTQCSTTEPQEHCVK